MISSRQAANTPFIVDRYLIREFAAPFCFALVMMGSLLSTGFVLFNLMEQSVQFKIPLTLAVQIFLLRLPEMFFYTLPMAALLGSMMAFSRLSADSEMLALRIMGWSFIRILQPFFCLGLLLSLLTVGVGELLLPPSAFGARKLLHLAQTGQIELPAEKSHLVIRLMENGLLRYLIYAQRAEHNQMNKVVMQIYTGGHLEAVLSAETAIWSDTNWRFINGQLVQWSDTNSTKVLTFSALSYALANSLRDIVNHNKMPMELNIRELYQHIQHLQAGGQHIQPLAVRMHQKLSLPMTTCLFVLLGATLGSRTLRSNMQGFGLSLLVVFVYYLIFSTGTALGDTGTIAPWLAAWGADLLLLGVLIWLVARQA